MRKLMIFMLVLALLVTCPVMASATGMELAFSDRTADMGQAVYLTVTLQEPVMGNSVAVTFTYDDTVLEACPENSKWSRKGILQDFGMVENAGVWTTDQTQNLQGDVCVLAFRVLPDTAFSDTKVSCTVIVKDSAELIETYSEEVILRSSCEHEYNDWVDQGDIGHSRTCKLCGGRASQSHTWDEGTVTEDAEDPNRGTKTYTCTACGAEKSSRVDLIPSQTESTKPNEEPDQGTVGGEDNLPTNNDHEHDDPSEGTRPNNPTENTQHDHSTDGTQHEHTEEEKDEGMDAQSVVLLVIVLISCLAITAGAVLYFVLKDKKTSKR